MKKVVFTQTGDVVEVADDIALCELEALIYTKLAEDAEARGTDAADIPKDFFGLVTGYNVQVV